MEWDCAAGDGILRALGLPVRSRATGTPLRYNSPRPPCQRPVGEPGVRTSFINAF